MSMAPLQVDGNDARWGVALGKGLAMRDSLWDGLTDRYAGTPMGITAENLAVKYGISREVSVNNFDIVVWQKFSSRRTFTGVDRY